MKELTIEQKAKAYDLAIEAAKKYHNGTLKDVMETIFPELKESEGEEIRKFLIQMAQNGHGGDRDWWNKCVAWLEKQSKASKVEETMREIEEKAKAFTEAHKGETSEEILAQMKGELMPTLGEEDERNFDIIYGIIYNSCNAEDASRLIEWLKSLKDRVGHFDDGYQVGFSAAKHHQWKPSDEQLNSLYDVLNPCDGLNRDVLESLYNDLKKLREG